ncbi:MAG: glycosyltransferase family 4 protein, partial [Solirubrobacteraceae bacterium]
PRPLRRALSLERRDESSADPEPGPPPVAPPTVSTRPVAPFLKHNDYEAPMTVWSDGEAPLRTPPPGMSTRERLRIAMVIPPFTRGSGGHNTLLQLLLRLERRGHVCSVWVHDYFGRTNSTWPAKLRHDIREWFAPIDGAVYTNFGDWHGADIVIATGWETVHPVLRLPDCYARAYIVNDHEPDFFAASAERVLAEDTYRHGLHCIAASPWLRDLLRSRYDASADAFQLGVDHNVYRPRGAARRGDTVIYYARHATPRRAVPIGLMALGELYRRRPDIRIVLFGTNEPVLTTFPYEHAGVLSGEQLALLYSQSTVGVCLSLTNFSLMPKEMLACGLPCVELAGVSAESIFGAESPIELSELSPTRIADAVEKLLGDAELWKARSEAGIKFVASHTWDQATDEVEAGLRHALQLRENVAHGAERLSAPDPVLADHSYGGTSVK